MFLVSEINIYEQFESDERMFVPLTIDDMEVEDTSYFFNGQKLAIAAIGLLPYFTIFFLLDYVTSIMVFVIYTAIYLTLYSFLLRFVVFEEKKQRDEMMAMENNKVSDMSYFWSWDKIGTGKRDDGMVYIQSDGVSLKRGYIIEVDSGSVVGVPDGHYRQFRQTQQDFFRSVSALGMDVKVYNIRKRPELSPALKRYARMLRDLQGTENEALIKLSQLNIDINFLYSITLDQRYVTYYVLVNKRLENLRNFKGIVQSVVDKTFGSNIAFSNARILRKTEVDEFLTVYFDQDAVNTSGLHKMNGFKNFSEFCDLVAVIDNEGRQVPVEIFDDIIKPDLGFAGNTSVEDLAKRELEKEAKWERRRVKSYETKEEALMKKRREDKITHREYEALLEQLKNDHLPENFNEVIELTEEGRRKKEQDEERERIKQERRDRVRQAKRQTEDTRKWYEKDEGVTEGSKEVKTRDFTKQEDSNIDWDSLDERGDITLDDLLK